MAGKSLLSSNKVEPLSKIKSNESDHYILDLRELSYFTGRGRVCLWRSVANFFWSPLPQRTTSLGKEKYMTDCHFVQDEPQSNSSTWPNSAQITGKCIFSPKSILGESSDWLRWVDNHITYHFFPYEEICFKWERIWIPPLRTGKNSTPLWLYKKNSGPPSERTSPSLLLLLFFRLGGTRIFSKRQRGDQNLSPCANTWDQNFSTYSKGGPEKVGHRPSQTDAPTPGKKMIAPLLKISTLLTSK